MVWISINEIIYYKQPDSNIITTQGGMKNRAGHQISWNQISGSSEGISSGSIFMSSSASFSLAGVASA